MSHLTVQYDTCKVDGDSCVNTPVVIFVKQMLFIQKYNFGGGLFFERENWIFISFSGKFLRWRWVRFLLITKSKNIIAASPIATLSYKPSIINTMPFDAAQLTAFWTSPDQMGLLARTRMQMDREGLVTPADFKDFSEKSDLNALVKLLLKPAKVPGVARGGLREVESYAIPAKS